MKSKNIMSDNKSNLNMLDFHNWKLFKVGNIFKCSTTPTTIGIDAEEGDIPYITRTGFNNGLNGYVDVDHKFITEGNCITVGAEGRYAFYQPKDFATGVKVYTLRNENLNESIALFICTILNTNIYKYSYGRARVLNKLKDEMILLPYALSGEPHWKLMEEYIKSLKSKKIATKNDSRNKLSLNPDNWEEFYLHRLFYTTMGNGIDAQDNTYIKPVYNYVSRNSNDNGIVDFVDQVEGKEPFPKGAITIALGGSYLGSSFIQPEPFYTAQNVGILLEKEPLSYATKLFITTLIRKEAQTKFQAFGRELNAHFRRSFVLKLPIQMENEEPLIDDTYEYSDEGYLPDWDFMEDYIKSLPYGDRIFI